MSHPISASIGPMPVHGNRGWTTRPESRLPLKGETSGTAPIALRNRYGAEHLSRRSPLDAHLEELKERCVLRDELVSESRCLGCGVGGALLPKKATADFVTRK